MNRETATGFASCILQAPFSRPAHDKRPGSRPGPSFFNGRAAYFCCCWPGLSLLGCGVPWFCCGFGAGEAGFCGSEDEIGVSVIVCIPSKWM
jgi:hypothetical protein